MKRKLLAFSLLMAGLGWSQRQTDLSVYISAPGNNSEVEFNQIVHFNVQCTIGGLETLHEDDSLFVYAAINGNPVIFPPVNEDHLVRTGNILGPGTTVNIDIPMVFSTGYENTTNEICFMILPVNASDEIEEIDMSDNEDCVSFTVIENNAALPENGANHFVVHPNPAPESFTIQGLNPGTELIITDVNGKQMPIDEIEAGTINCASWQNGYYMIRINENNMVIMKRLLINH